MTVRRESLNIYQRNCPNCGHITKGHELDVLGKARCPECPDEYCQEREGRVVAPNTNDSSLVTIGTLGVGFLKEMNKEALIQEIMDVQRAYLMTLDQGQLVRMVAQIRTSAARKRIYDEAGIHEFGGLWGYGE